MGTIYKLVSDYAKKYPGTVAWRKKSHAKVIEKHLNPEEHVTYAFCCQKGYNSFDIFNTYAVAITNKRIIVAQKRLLFGYLFLSITPDMFNDLSIKSGIIWGADSSKEFDAVYNGKKNHVYCVSTHNVKHNGSYVPCYCIDPGIEIGTGTPYDDYLLTTNDAWNSLSNQQRRAIGLALIYGYPNSINPSSFLDKKGAQAATQMIIWENHLIH